MSPFARIARNALNLGSSEVVAKAAGFIVTLFLTRALHPDGYGRFALAYAFAAIVGLAAEGGLTYFVAREVARAQRAARRIVWTALALRVTLAVTAGLIALAVLPLFGFGAEGAVAAGWLMLSTLADGFVTQCMSLFRGRQQMAVEARLVSAGRLLLLACVLVAIRFAPGVAGVAVAYAAASGLTAAAALTLVVRVVPPIRPRPLHLRLFLREGMTFFAGGVFIYIFFRIDVLLLRAFGVSEAAIGFYSAAFRVMEVTRSPSGVFAAGFAPAAAVAARRRERGPLLHLGSRTLATVIGIALIPTLVFLLAPELLARLLFGGEYALVGPLLFAMAPMPLLMATDSILLVLVNADGLQRWSIVAFAAVAAFNIVLNLIAIPILGVLGCAIATDLTEAALAAALWAIVARRIGGLAPPIRLTATAFALAAACAFLVGSSHPIARIAIGLTIYGLAATLLVLRGRTALA